MTVFPDHSSASSAAFDASIRTVRIKTANNKPIESVPVYVNRPLRFAVIPEDAQSSQKASSCLEIIWDSQFSQGIRRRILLRSPVMFRNRLEYPLSLRLTLLSDTVVELGPIAEDDVLYLPLPLCDQVAFFSARSAKADVGWSPNFLLEELARANEQQAVTYCTVEDSQFVYSSVYHEADRHCLIITFSFNILLTNTLPCIMRYRCFCEGVEVIEGILLPGKNKKIAHNVAVSNAQTYLQVSVGSLEWSRPLFVHAEKFGCFELKNAVSVSVCDESERRQTTLALNYFSKTDAFVTSVQVFSKYVSIDRTGLDLSFHIKSLDGSIAVRKSFAEENKLDDAITKLIGENLDELPRVPAGVFAINNVTFRSSRSYNVCFLNEGVSVFTDRPCVIKSLPVGLHSQPHRCHVMHVLLTPRRISRSIWRIRLLSAQLAMTKY